MAGINRDLSWGAFQQDQMRVLKSIEKSLGQQLELGRGLVNTMSSVEHALSSIASATEASAKNLYTITKELTGSAVEFTRTMDQASTSTTRFLAVVDHTADHTEEFGQRTREAGLGVTEFVSSLASNLSRLGKHVDAFVDVSNQMIRLSGMAGNSVRDFRSSVMDTVADLNTTTGSAYSPEKSYEKLVSVTQGVTSNLEAIQEMTRPLLLAQESLDADLTNIATLFNRFYTRYAFSSSHMEETLDYIRGNTAGNAADAEVALRNIETLKSFIDNYAVNDNELREELMKSVSNYTSWIESMDMDSGKFTEALVSAAYGDWDKNTGLSVILDAAGMDQLTATELARSGGYEEFTKAYMDGVYAIMKQHDMNNDGSLGSDEIAILGPMLDALQLDRDISMDIWNAVNSNNYTSLQDFIDQQSGKATTMEELVEDKYVSLAEKTNNWLEQIYAKIADIQEYLPFGVSDIALAIALLGRSGIFDYMSNRGSTRGNIGSPRVNPGGTAATLRSMIGTTGSVPYSGTGFLGNLATAGYNAAGYSQSGLYLGSGMSGSQAAALGGASLAGVGAGVGMGIYGYSQGIQDIKAGDTGYGVANIAGGTAGLVGAGALGASMLGVGAANIWNPVGWAALIAGAVTLVATEIHKATSKIGAVDAIEAEYEAAKLSVKQMSLHNEDILLEVKSGLKHEADLEEMRSKLINSGIMSETDIEKARKANKEGLESLTEAYIQSTQKFSTDMELGLDKYEQANIEYASKLHGDLEEMLQEWNDSGKLKNGSKELEAVESLMYSLYKDLDKRKSGGEEFDKETQKIYNKMAKAFKDGSLSKSEANSIIDSGMWNTFFQNASFSTESLMAAVYKMEATNSKGAKFVKNVLPDGTYYADAPHVLELAYKALNATSKSSAKEYLDQLKSEGYTSAVYSEIGEAAAKWGLQGYAQGTNYILKDQIALLHEGEAVVPKRYNPAANMNELEILREQARQNSEQVSEETRKSQEYMKQTFTVLNEIREFLTYWRDDNIQRESIKDTRGRLSAANNYLTSYAIETT